ncbi:MAG: nucleotidyltransferase domain-containing protein [Chitinophagaceae bacterium]
MGTDKNIIYKQLQNYFADKPVKRVFVFGSFARNEEKDSSDIDLIISPSHPVGLFALGKYISDLEEITNRKVDIATQNSITPEFLALIQKDLKQVYAA